MELQKKNKGFAAMSIEERKRIASMGGKALSKNKIHMSIIGEKGGTNSGIVRGQKAVETKSKDAQEQ